MNIGNILSKTLLKILKIITLFENKFLLEYHFLIKYVYILFQLKFFIFLTLKQKTEINNRQSDLKHNVILSTLLAE